MIKVSNVIKIVVFFLCFQSFSAYAKQSLLEANVDAKAEYNDNIFITDKPHDPVYAVVISPSITGKITELNWQASISARLDSQKYNDHTLDGTDHYYSLSSQYQNERNIFSLNLQDDLDSNLNYTASDFGVIGRRVNTERQTISPQYTRLVTERLALTLSYTYTDVDFDDLVASSYTPYIVKTGLTSIGYNLTEKDQIVLSYQVLDYDSKDDRVVYKLYSSQLALDHQFSETLSVNIALGISRLNATTTSLVQVNDIFGNPVTIIDVRDFENRSRTYSAGFTQLLDTGSFEGDLSRNFTSNSFGGLDRVDRVSLGYSRKIDPLWRYKFNARADDVDSVNSGGASLSRKLYFLDATSYYSVNKDWNIYATYQYTAREFSNDTSNNSSPHSNSIYIGLSYNFPAIATF